MNSPEPIALPDSCRPIRPGDCDAERLATEAQLIRPALPPELAAFPWGRERFLRRRASVYGTLLAYTVTSAGRIVRGWYLRPDDHRAYSQPGMGCPIEAAWLASVQVGRPSLPAHLWIGADRGLPGYREALSELSDPD